MSRDGPVDTLRRLEARALLALASVLRPLPLRTRVRCGHLAGRIAWSGVSRRRRLACENVARALSVPEDTARTIARRSFLHFGRVLVECLCLPVYSREPAVSRLEVRGFEHFLAAQEMSRGVIVFSAHFGNWELIALRQALAGHPLDFIARPLDNPILEQSFAEWRAQAGNRVLGKRGALRRAVASLRSGRSLAILIDQNVRTPPRLFLPFLQRPASVTPSLGQLAVRLGVPAVPVVSHARDDGGYAIEYMPALELPEGADRDERALALTRSAVRVIEGWIRDRPEQWLWMHDRWKSGPGPGEEVLP